MQLQTKIAIGLGIVLVGLGAYFFIGSSRPEPIALDEPARRTEPAKTKTGERASRPAPTETGRSSPARSADTRSQAPVRRVTEPAETRPLPPREQTTAPPSGESMPNAAARLPESTTDGSARLPTATTTPPIQLPPQQTVPAQTEAGPPANRGTELAIRPTQGPPVLTTPAAPVREHVVQAGDTFSSLAIEYYGSQRHTQFLIAANPQVTNPNLLKIGTKLKVPALTASTVGASPAGTAQAGRSAQTPGPNQYLIREGDTFYSIAQAKLGDARRWPQLYEINKDLFPEGPEAIRPGVVIQLSESR